MTLANASNSSTHPRIAQHARLSSAVVTSSYAWNAGTEKMPSSNLRLDLSEFTFELVNGRAILLEVHFSVPCKEDTDDDCNIC